MPLVGPPQRLAIALQRVAPRVWSFFSEETGKLLTGLPEPVRIVNWWRSPSENARVGGSPSSQHLIATALDLADVRTGGRAMPAALRQELVRRARRSWGFVLDEHDHVHVQVWPASTALRIVESLVRGLRL